MGRGRKFNTKYPLGQLMLERGMTVAGVHMQTGVHPRTLSNYLANRVRITNANLARLADLLDVDPGDLIPAEPPKFGNQEEYRLTTGKARLSTVTTLSE